MNSLKFSFAWTFSIMVLLAFGYVSFMGLVYHSGGAIAVPALLTLAMMAVVVGCVAMMCMSRATRWRGVGTVGQIVFGVIVLVVLLLSSVPFTNFLRVCSERETIRSEANSAIDAAARVDAAYQSYADARLTAYKDNLSLIAKGKAINPSRYNEVMGGASGSSDATKIDNLARSLKTKLLPDSTEEIAAQRRRSLEKARDASVLNPLMPKNIAAIDSLTSGWVENYRTLSLVKYQGEEAQPFTYDVVSSRLGLLTSSYREWRLPSAVAVIAALACFGIMLLPFFVTRRSLAGASTGRVLFE